MQLRDEADIVSGARINGNNRFRADLKVLSRPDEATRGIATSGQTHHCPYRDIRSRRHVRFEAIVASFPTGIL